MPLFQHVASLVANEWNTNGQCALVVGATFPEEIARVRQIVGDLPLLVPGIGAQGGDVQATMQAGRTADGTGLMINSCLNARCRPVPWPAGIGPIVWRSATS